VVIVYQAEPAGPPPGDHRIIPAGDPLDLKVPYSRQVLDHHRAAGWSLHGWFEGGAPVSFAWARRASSHRVTEVGSSVEATGDSGWIVHCITPLEHRGQGFYPNLIQAVGSTLGSSAVYIYCLEENLASRRGIEKAGFRQVGTVTRRRGRLSTTVPGWILGPLTP
jgi:hypothetical protein